MDSFHSDQIYSTPQFRTMPQCSFTDQKYSKSSANVPQKQER